VRWEQRQLILEGAAGHEEVVQHLHRETVAWDDEVVGATVPVIDVDSVGHDHLHRS
jgi:hypothetical protein